jgi:hypothetical protein
VKNEDKDAIKSEDTIHSVNAMDNRTDGYYGNFDDVRLKVTDINGIKVE